ncbi:MAG: DUF167 domain-containing protein [Aggregatilineales bacterium]
MSDLTNRNFEITDARGGAAIGVRVVTRADATEIAGKTEEGNLKIRLKASPAGDPAANAELVAFLADKLGVTTKDVEIVAGEGSRDKILSFADLTAETLEEKLMGGL